MDETFEVSATLLDRLIVDVHGTPCGRVDDIELTFSDGGAPRLSALLCGSQALGPRLGHKLGEWWSAFGRHLRNDASDQPVRVPWALVKAIRPGEVEMAVPLSELPTDEGRRWADEHVVRHIPGA